MKRANEVQVAAGPKARSDTPARHRREPRPLRTGPRVRATSRSGSRACSGRRRAGSPRDTRRSYTVVARRYRPQRFEDVVGQDHVVQALRNAIRLNRIAQAYLFCGTRGVGKTSMARIFAKCLNCVKGPTEEPCQTCDICQSIALGQDVDVIEIDGASNNGVEQVRELRQNAALRPSRARLQDLLHRRSAHALDRGLQRPVEDAGRAAAARQVLLRHHRGEQDSDHRAVAVPAVRLRRHHARGDRGDAGRDLRAGAGRSRARGPAGRRPPRRRLAARRAVAPGSAPGLGQPAADGRGRPWLARDGQRRAVAGDARGPGRSRCRRGASPARAERRRGRPARRAARAESSTSCAMPWCWPSVPSRCCWRSRRGSGRSSKRIVERWTVDSILAALQILSECRARMRGSLHGRLLVELALVRVARLEDLTRRWARWSSGSPRSSRERTGARRPDLAVKTTEAKPPPQAATLPAGTGPAAGRSRTVKSPPETVVAPTSGARTPPQSPRRRAAALRRSSRRRQASSPVRGALERHATATTAVMDPPDGRSRLATAPEGESANPAASQRRAATGSRRGPESLA